MERLTRRIFNVQTSTKPTIYTPTKTNKMVFTVRCRSLNQADQIRESARQAELSVNEFMLRAAIVLIAQQKGLVQVV